MNPFKVTLKVEKPDPTYSFDELGHRSIGRIQRGKYKGLFVLVIKEDVNEPILVELTGLFYLKGKQLKEFGSNIEALNVDYNITLSLSRIPESERINLK